MQVVNASDMPKHLYDELIEDKYNESYILYYMDDENEYYDTETYNWLKEQGVTDECVLILVNW